MEAIIPPVIIISEMIQMVDQCHYDQKYFKVTNAVKKTRVILMAIKLIFKFP
jgi:hypothetical protein